jgi:hypothetical protein
MPPLPTDLRSHLERTVIAARDTAETAARASLIALAVERDAPFASMSDGQRRLRRGLRAKARQLGGGNQTAGIPLLLDEIAYQQWHRMLFARFLAENSLLMHPEGVAVTLAECAELAPEEGAADAWELAARYAAAMLPGLFPVDEPAVQVRFAAEHRLALERLLDGLPAAVFASDDGLGWVYQFWQSKRKEEVNRSERKIGGADLAPVTQLFTEDYMVQFLLHNTLGAWWAARHPDSPLLQQFEYLRWVGEAGELGELAELPEQADGQSRANPPPLTINHSPFTIHHSPPRLPAAGPFPHWPDAVAQVTMLDPCGGSGHFVVAALSMFVPMRMEEEGLSEQEAVAAVLRDNLFMLDIDPRCCQIATFNLLLAAWKRAGYRDDLPTPHIACSGIAVEGQLDDWLRLAGDPSSGSGQAVRLHTSLTRLHGLLRDAPTLGSLIDPAHVPLHERLFSADYDAVLPVLERALRREGRADDPAAAVLGQAAEGALRAARLLGRQYTLVATNVPYLARGKQGETLRDFCQRHAPEAKNDLATVFLQRCLDFCAAGGTASLVLPQNWLFLTSYRQLREKLLKAETWHLVARLGEGGFDSTAAAGAFTTLITLSRAKASEEQAIHGLDVSALRPASAKAAGLLTAEIKRVGQWRQLRNPDARVVFENIQGESLERFAGSYQGLKTGDDGAKRRFFWEQPFSIRWTYLQSTVDKTMPYGGMESVVDWAYSGEDLARLQGLGAWMKPGVVVSQMRELPVALYLGHKFDSNASALPAHELNELPAIWCFCSSREYAQAVRSIDQKMSVTNATLLKVPFDLDHWTQVAQERYPDGLPEPWSNDPTQWLFNGHPVGSTEPLHVAVARLLGYRWPAQQPSPPAPLPAGEGSQSDDGLDAFADRDGIVCLAAVAGEQPAAERLRALLAHAYSHPPALPDFERYRVGDFVPTTPAPPDAGWSVQTQERLLAHAGYAGRTLDDWLRDGFFEQHCRLFHNRPFLWHVWDGRKDGFQALVSYHKLDAALLDKLIYTYLGAWISDQRAERDTGVAGADGRLVAALELQKKLVAIREGEPPYDLYVRWKPVAEQPIGWNPDLNDGVRLNIRPWVTAGVLRKRFTIHWNKDRGKNPDGSERINDLHWTRVEKMAAPRVKHP